MAKANEDAFLARQGKLLLIIPCGIFYLLFDTFIRPRMELLLRDKTQDYRNAWKNGETFDARVYLSIYPELNLDDSKSYKLLHEETDMVYFTDKIRGKKLFSFNHTIPFSDSMKVNKTIPYYIIVYSPSRCGFLESYDSNNYCASVKTKYPIIRWNHEPMIVKRNLIRNNKHETPAEENPIGEGMPYHYAEVNFDLVYDVEPRNVEDYVYSHNYKYFLFAKQIRIFMPPSSYDQFLEIRQHRQPLNMTANRPDINSTITVYLRNYWLWDYKLVNDYTADSYKQIKHAYEDLKSALYDTPKLLLYTYIGFLLVNMLFKILSFIEELSWWTTRETFEGISLQALVYTAIAQFFVLLYIIDEDASNIEIANLALSWLFSVWKVTRLFELKQTFPYFKVKDDYTKKTKLVDMIGGRYFLYIIVPLLLVYSIYQLFYAEFKSFYSFFLQTIVSGIYAFGFLAMFPQVYVNYKLKSVAGMSATALIYKFISTFIDDLYAFVMKMPLLHRIACFRDDIIFIIWIYQCFIYKVDPTRANEFGEVLAKPEEIEAEKKMKKEEEEKNKEEHQNEEGVEHRGTKEKPGSDD